MLLPRPPRPLFSAFVLASPCGRPASDMAVNLQVGNTSAEAPELPGYRVLVFVELGDPSTGWSDGSRQPGHIAEVVREVEFSSSWGFNKVVTVAGQGVPAGGGGWFAAECTLKNLGWLKKSLGWMVKALEVTVKIRLHGDLQPRGATGAAQVATVRHQLGFGATQSKPLTVPIALSSLPVPLQWPRGSNATAGILPWTDDSFPAGPASLDVDPAGFTLRKPIMGKLSKGSRIEWVRVPELLMRMGTLGTASLPALFVDGADRGDIRQGVLDDCWLLSSLASLSRSPGAIESLFAATPIENAAGRYQLSLFDGLARRWVVIEIDDRVPAIVRPGGKPRPYYDLAAGEWKWTCPIRPLGTHPNGAEMWPLLAEKAVAKFCGSYQALVYGFPASALEAMTGAEVQQLQRPPVATAPRGPHGAPAQQQTWTSRTCQYSLPAWQASWKDPRHCRRGASKALRQDVVGR